MSSPIERKRPRRTAERILEVTLALFNRFGEPNVSTTLISEQLSISPGNLYYHYPSKDALINTLAERYERQLTPMLTGALGVENVEDAWLLVHMWVETLWNYRFLYRDVNDLLSKNRQLEARMQGLMKATERAMRAMLDGLSRSGNARLSGQDSGPLASAMVVVLTYWLSYAYVREPRQALEPENAQAALGKGAFHTLALLNPYLDAASSQHLRRLAGAYLDA